MSDIGDAAREPVTPATWAILQADPETLAWAQEVSRAVQAAYQQGVPPDYAMERMREQAARRQEPATPADPAAEIEAALREYDADVAAGAFMLPDLPPGPGTCTGCGGPTGDAKMAVCVYCTAFALEDTGAGEMQVISKLDRLLDRLIATMMLVGLVLMISVIMMVLR